MPRRLAFLSERLCSYDANVNIVFHLYLRRLSGQRQRSPARSELFQRVRRVYGQSIGVCVTRSYGGTQRVQTTLVAPPMSSFAKFETRFRP